MYGKLVSSCLMISVHNKSNNRVSLRCGGQLAARQGGGHASLETWLGYIAVKQ